MSGYRQSFIQIEPDSAKQERTLSSNDDVPMLNDGPKELLYKTPKIETSFGGSRIGEVYEHPTKN